MPGCLPRCPPSQGRVEHEDQQDNDAEGLAHLVRSGWYREVRVKSREAMLERSLLGARTQLLNMVTDLSNQILMKTVPKGTGTVFECAGCSRMRRPWPCCHCWT